MDERTLEYIAELSRLTLPQEEKAELLEQMQQILDYMELLNTDVADQLFPDDRRILTKPHDNPPACYRRGARVRNAIVSGGCQL